jgi:hypothetical protein
MCILLDAEDRHLLGMPWRLMTTRGKTYAWTKDPESRGTLYLHRLMTGLKRGDLREVDHLNGDGLDNRRANIRVVTHAQNLQNQRPQQGRSSRFRNVSYDKYASKWRVCMKINGRTLECGRYKDEEEAGRVAVEMRKIHLPFSVETAA